MKPMIATARKTKNRILAIPAALVAVGHRARLL
jgi:hypothetical protein